MLSIQTFATHKNDIRLFPFLTDEDGIARITQADMRAEAVATYDSGLMDYSAIETAHEMIEIHLVSCSELALAIDARTRSWTSLLKGENTRWRSIEQLVETLRTATNHKLVIPDALSIRPKVRARWNQPDATCEYLLRVRTQP